MRKKNEHKDIPLGTSLDDIQRDNLDIPFGPVPDLKNFTDWLRKISRHVEVQEMKIKILTFEVRDLDNKIQQIKNK